MSADTLESLLFAGESAGLDVLAGVTDPARLEALAAPWLACRGEAWQLLLDYLARPVNPFHEPLLLALLALAERDGDDEVMGALFVLADRALQPAGCEGVEAIGDVLLIGGSQAVWLGGEQVRAGPLFGPAARLEMRLRAWAYFDRMGREYPRRYAGSVGRLLFRYTDRDAGAVTALLANWCLCHVLYGLDDELTPDPDGRRWHGPDPWRRPPRPPHESAWGAAPEMLLALTLRAGSAVIRGWAGELLWWQSPQALRRLPLEQLLTVLRHGSPGQAAAIAELLRLRGGLEELSTETWLSLLGDGRSGAAKALCQSHLPLERLTTEQATRLAASNSPGADVAWHRCLAPRLERGEEPPAELLLSLLDSPRRDLRPVMAQAVRAELMIRMPFEPRWSLIFLNHAYADVRQIGWEWFANDARLRDEVGLWRLLARSDRDDVRGRLLDRLELEQRGQPAVLRDALPLDERVLWARLLLTLYGPWKKNARSLARLLTARLEWRPEDAPALWPMLGELLRATAGPTWREALAGAVRLLERRPEQQALAVEAAPELRLREDGSHG